MKSDICKKKDLWCECNQCEKYWKSHTDDVPDGEDSGFEQEKESDLIYELDGWN